MKKLILLMLVAMLPACAERAPEPAPANTDTVAIPVKQPEEPTDTNALRMCHGPWGMMAGEGLPKKGVYPYVAASVLEHAGYTVEVDIINWTRCLEDVKQGKYDLVTALWESEPLRAEFKFLNNSTIDKMSFFTTVDTGLDSGEIADLEGRSVAIVRDVGGTQAFYSNEDLFRVYKLPDQRQVLEMLLQGRAELTIAEERQFLDLALAETPDQAHRVKALHPPLQLNYASPAMRVDHPRWSEIASKYDRAYRELVNAGLYDELESEFGVRFDFRPPAQAELAQ